MVMMVMMMMVGYGVIKLDYNNVIGKFLMSICNNFHDNDDADVDV